jgi:hypothetical protein
MQPEPVPKPANSLTGVASFTRHIREQYLAAAQFPNPLALKSGKTLAKPLWV